MAESVTETNSLVEFVTTNYTSLLSSVASDNAPADISVKLGPVVTLIETLFATFKTLDSTHDVIVDQLKDLQTAYAGLELNKGDYPRYAAASDNLKRIVVALKEDDAGSKGEGEGEGEGEEEEE